jgi:hypothetical protein
MKPVLWVTVLLLLLGAAMILADIGAAGVWIASIAVAIALVVIDRRSPHTTGNP